MRCACGWAWHVVRGTQGHEKKAVAAAEAVGAADGLKKDEGKKIFPDPSARANSVVAAGVLASKSVAQTNDDASPGGTGNVRQVLK